MGKTVKIILKVIGTAFVALLTFWCCILLGFAAEMNGGGLFEVYLSMFYGFIVGLTIVLWIWGAIYKKFVWIPLLSVFVVSIAVGGVDSFIRGLNKLEDDNVEKVYADFNMFEYEPFGEDSKVALLDGEPSISLGEDDLPVMDGAAALFPVYSAFIRALYPWGYEPEYFNTRGAYESIVDGTRDIIFVAAPSEDQLAYANEKGVELNFTPIGREAFVFFVNSENSVADLTSDQIRGIYSGKIKNWSELGFPEMGKIRAFQRNEGSGSQTALINFMGNEDIMDPPVEDVSTEMGGIIRQTADYRNYKNSIGFSFRFYATEMVKNDKIKLLSIDGVAPTEENVRNGSYPLINEFYAVTRSDADEKTLQLLDWILGPQGQELIEKTGYTPINQNGENYEN